MPASFYGETSTGSASSVSCRSCAARGVICLMEPADMVPATVFPNHPYPYWPDVFIKTSGPWVDPASGYIFGGN